MKTIVLFGAGKSATILIDYLLTTVERYRWRLIIADANKELILIKTNYSRFAEAIQLDINNEADRSSLVQQAHVVISMMPPDLHFLIAKDCVEYRKHLLTASYVDDKIKSLRDEIADRKLLFLCEMGLDPGIDHMSAMKIINDIKAQGGTITSFKSHCGGLIAPFSDTNLWRYKICWNPRNIVLAGKSGAEYKLNGAIKHMDYVDLFDDSRTIQIRDMYEMVYYPNRDSLSYISLYNLPEAHTFMRTTLRYSVFFQAWKALVKGGLTDDIKPIDPKGLLFAYWAAPILLFVNKDNRRQLFALGIFDEENYVPQNAKTSADILQYLLEKNLLMQPDDQDMIVMFHEFEYELNGVEKKLNSKLVVLGENALRTAMAKTVGLPLGIAAKLILTDVIQLKGLHIPTVKEIYEPVLKELALNGVVFEEYE